MTGTLHRTGEEFLLRVALDTWSTPTDCRVLLYEDAIDTLADDDDIGAITTEPDGSDYTRQTVPLDGSAAEIETDQGGTRFAIDRQTFDVDDAERTVDAYAITTDFRSAEQGETSPSEHLLVTGGLVAPVDLIDTDQFTLTTAGIVLD
jgi:hypothetical protein